MEHDSTDRTEAAISNINPSASEMRSAPVTVVPLVPPKPPVPVARVARAPLSDIEAHISEFAADVAGSMSPFGDDLEFPLPVERLGYRHPLPVNRPALAGD